jgi:hypothetical protein
MTHVAHSRPAIVLWAVLVSVFALAGVGWVVGAVFVLLFMAVAPGAALCRLLGLTDEHDTTTIVAASLSVDAVLTETMLYAHIWTPVAGVVALAVFTSILVLVDIVRSRSRSGS